MLEMICQTFNDESMWQIADFEWHNLFVKDGRESVEDKPTLDSHWTDDNVQLMCGLLNLNRRFNVGIVTDEIGIDKMTVYSIITEN